MKPVTSAKLKELEQANWFGAVGRSRIGGAKMVSSWMEAVVSCADSKWQTVQYDAMYLHKLAVHDKLRRITPEDRYRLDMEAIRGEVTQGNVVESGPYLKLDFPEWDQAWKALQPGIVAMVKEKTKAVVDRDGLPDVVVKRATWDVVCMAMEWEFSEVEPPGFYDDMSGVYLHGHFLCGWEGRFPEGQPIVY